MVRQPSNGRDASLTKVIFVTIVFSKKNNTANMPAVNTRK